MDFLLGSCFQGRATAMSSQSSACLFGVGGPRASSRAWAYGSGCGKKKTSFSSVFLLLLQTTHSEPARPHLQGSPGKPSPPAHQLHGQNHQGHCSPPPSFSILSVTSLAVRVGERAVLHSFLSTVHLGGTSFSSKTSQKTRGLKHLPGYRSQLLLSGLHS